MDITVGDHGNKEHLRYYPLADHTVGVDIRDNVLGKYDVDEFLIMDCDQKLDFKGDSFDMVFSDHTIEHLEEPLKFYRELQRIGKEFVLILTPHWLADSMNKTQKKIFPKKEADEMIQNIQGRAEEAKRKLHESERDRISDLKNERMQESILAVNPDTGQIREVRYERQIWPEGIIEFDPKSRIDSLNLTEWENERFGIARLEEEKASLEKELEEI